MGNQNHTQSDHLAVSEETAQKAIRVSLGHLLGANNKMMGELHVGDWTDEPQGRSDMLGRSWFATTAQT